MIYFSTQDEIWGEETLRSIVHLVDHNMRDFFDQQAYLEERAVFQVGFLSVQAVNKNSVLEMQRRCPQAQFFYWLVHEDKTARVHEISLREISPALVNQLLNDPKIDGETLLGPLIREKIK
ncbi:MAG: hypothetical protein Q4G02_01450 [bacterium]|nr:hypothetical protein [bacterium]